MSESCFLPFVDESTFNDRPGKKKREKKKEKR